MSESSNFRGFGIGFNGMLAVAFIVLKLCHVIKWSWLWVLAPLWIPLALLLLGIIVLGIAAFVQIVVRGRRR